MPRVVESPGTKVLNFFGGAPLAVAVLVLGLAQDIVRARKNPAAVVRVVTPKKAVKHRQPKAAPASVAAAKPKRRKRASRAKATHRTAPAEPVVSDAELEQLD